MLTYNRMDLETLGYISNDYVLFTLAERVDVFCCQSCKSGM